MGTEKSEYILDICRKHPWQNVIGGDRWRNWESRMSPRSWLWAIRSWWCHSPRLEMQGNCVASAAKKLTYGHKMPVHAEMSVRELWEQADLGVSSIEAEEPSRLQSIALLRIGYNWESSLSLFTFIHWRRKWQPTPVFLPGESQGRGAWWAAVYGVAQSRTQLKQLSSSTEELVRAMKMHDIFQEE